MDINELKLHTNNLSTYNAYDVMELEFMTDEELWELQYEIEHSTGNHSEWDILRAILTFRKQILDLIVENNKLR